VVWLSLGSVNVGPSYQPFNVPLLGDSLIRIEVSLLGKGAYNLNRLDFIWVYLGGLSEYAFRLPAQDISVIRPCRIDPLLFDAGFTVRDLRVKHNLIGLIDTTAVVAEGFYWEYNNQ